MLDYAGYADKIAGESYKEEDGFYKIVQYEPIGVCAGIAAWNATLVLVLIRSLNSLAADNCSFVAWKIAPALAAGNTVGSMLHSENTSTNRSGTVCVQGF